MTGRAGGVYGCDQLGRPLLFKMEFNSIPKHVREKARKVGKEALREYVQGGRQHDARVRGSSDTSSRSTSSR